MHKFTMLLLLPVLQLPLQAKADDTLGLGKWEKLQGSYMIHSGGTAYAELPTRNDRALSILLEGKAAKEVFDQIGPDAKVKCSSETRDRERRNKGVSCTYTARLDHQKDFHYRCWIGINLRSGEGDVRVSC
ncbi:hypothetical protein [Pseudoduganella sp.]|uniref:hypothetical protein n=1 Tax=Pseudoduganella sp. TaxID=1880898 RepID=UPI0035B092E0